MIPEKFNTDPESGLIYNEIKVISQLKCNHHLVLKIWDTGSWSGNPHDPMLYNLHLLFKDDTRQDFSGENPFEVRMRAEEFLKTLKINEDD